MKLFKNVLFTCLLAGSLSALSFDMKPSDDRSTDGVDFDTVVEEAPTLSSSTPLVQSDDCNQDKYPKGLISKDLLDKMKYHKDKSKFKIDFNFPEDGDTNISLRVTIPRMIKACAHIQVMPTFVDGRIYVKFINNKFSGHSPEGANSEYEKCLKKEGILKDDGTLRKLDINKDFTKITVKKISLDNIDINWNNIFIKRFGWG